MDESFNWSISAIPAVYILGILPHSYSVTRMSAASNGKYTNISPRKNFESGNPGIPETVYDHCVRARGAHLNAFEGFPLFAAAVIVGNMANLSASELNTLSAQYIAVRILYTLLYLGIQSEAGSYLRSSTWICSLALPMWTLVKAGRALNL